MENLSQAIPAFLAQKKVDAGLAPNSTSAYAADLAQFAAFCASDPTLGRDDPAIDTISPDTLEAFLNDRRAAGAGPATLARKASSLRQFFRFAVLELGLELNPADELRSLQAKRALPKALSTDAVTALLGALEAGLPYAKHGEAEALRARDRALVTLLYATGLRVSELLAIEAGAIDFDLSVVRVRGKGSKERLVPFVAVARDRLIDYRDYHRGNLLSAKAPRSARVAHPFFVSERGEPLTRQAFWKFLKQLAFHAGVTERLSPHWLRHTFATHLLEAGLNLRTLQLLLGHADVATTQIYTEVSPAHLKAVHSRYHPRGGEE